MMTLCQHRQCPEWAQWRARKPEWDAEHKKIVAWELIAVLCAVHKQEQQSMPENKDLRFDFSGAVPLWH